MVLSDIDYKWGLEKISRFPSSQAVKTFVVRNLVKNIELILYEFLS